MERWVLEELLLNVRHAFEGTCEQQQRSKEALESRFTYSETQLLQRVQAGETVLDLGCAAGRVALLLAQRGAYVIGTDIAYSLLLEASNLAHGRQIDIYLVQCAPFYIPFKESVFDKVVFFKTYCYVPGRANRIHWLHEIRRALKDKGEVLFSQYVIDDALGSYDLVREDTARRFPDLEAQLEEGDGFSAPAEDGDKPWYIRYFLERDLLSELDEGGFVVGHGERKEHIFYCILKNKSSFATDL